MKANRRRKAGINLDLFTLFQSHIECSTLLAEIGGRIPSFLSSRISKGLQVIERSCYIEAENDLRRSRTSL